MNRVLILESDRNLADVFKTHLEEAQLWVMVAQDVNQAHELIKKQLFHVALVSLNSDNSVSLISEIKQSRVSLAVIGMASDPSPQLVVESMRSGASNFWSKSEAKIGLREIVLETLSRVVPESVSDFEMEFPFPQFIGKHPRILEIQQLIMSIRNSDSTVLITGESGTGKEVVARAIHGISPRRKHPWVAVNCGAIPASLLESELFGHVKGAFTGATQNRLGRFQCAGSGTLFLDEISDLPFDLQAKILRAIQQRVFEPVGSPQSVHLDARIIAATNQDLETAVAEKRFREDLFYRLNVIPIFIPPLRARKTDIPLLVRSFVEKFCKANQKEFRGISEDAMQCLMQYHWPGNIRELENLIERVIVLKRSGGMIELKDFPIQHFKNVRLDRFVANIALPDEGLDFNEAVNEFENELILQALQKTAGNKNRAASLLNLNRTTLVEKLKRKGLRISA